MNYINAKYIDHMGHDVRVTDIARQSFNSDIAPVIRKEEELSQKDINLIRFLGSGYRTEERDALMSSIMTGGHTNEQAQDLIDSIKHHATHWTPFAHCMVTLACTAPISVVRQLYKTKVGFVENEVSRRYVDSAPAIFQVKEFRARPEGSIKQGSAGIHTSSELWVQRYDQHCDNCQKLYAEMIADGVAPEQARFVLPQSMMVDWTWTGSLYTWAHLYNLRMDKHVQEETRQFASIVGNIISELFPYSWEALTRQDVTL